MEYRTLTEDDIKKINTMCPEDHGIFREASCVPVHIKEPVIYKRWNSGGMTGGSYHEDSYLHPYHGDSEPPFVALKIALDAMGLNTLLSHKIEESGLVQEVSDTDDTDYYGNVDDYEIRYIPLSDLYNFIQRL
jgi:hypothetical protein